MLQSEICCVCLRNNLELVSVTDGDPNTVKWSSKLEQCVPEVVWSEEDLICCWCIEQVDAACALRDLCLQSYTIRQQLLENEVKDEEIIIEEDVKIEIIPEEVKKINLTDTVHEYQTLDDKCDPSAENTEPKENKKKETQISKSFLRDLLQAPQEVIRRKKLALSKECCTNTSAKSIQNCESETLLLTEPVGLMVDNDSDDSVQYVETEQSENCTAKTEADKSLEKSLFYVRLNDDFDRKIEMQNTTNEKSVKSLLRDLLLKPPESRREKHQDSNFQNVEETENFVKGEDYCSLPPSISIQDNHELLSTRDSNINNNGSFKNSLNLVKFDNEHKSASSSFLTELQFAQSKYNCSACGRSFNTTSDSVKYETTEDDSVKERFVCQHCDQHLNVNNSNSVTNEFLCSDCSASFSSKSLLLDHMQYKHNSENLMKQCQICPNSYGNQSELDLHLFEKHNMQTMHTPKMIKKYKCGKCMRVYTTMKAKNNHSIKCDGVRRHMGNNFDNKFQSTP